MASRVSGILKRMAECAEHQGWEETPRHLLHAYAACLTPSEIGEAALLTLSDTTAMRGAIRNRMLRLGREGAAPAELDALGHALLALEPCDGRQRTRIDALIAQLYAYLGPAARQGALERWRDRGTSGALARWVKAVASDDALFDTWEVAEVWRRSVHPKAAALLAKRGHPECLTQLLPELVAQDTEGWIVSRAALRAATVTEAAWEAICARLPATYAYLCAKTGRPCSDDERWRSSSSPKAASRATKAWLSGPQARWVSCESWISSELSSKARNPMAAQCKGLQGTGSSESGKF